MIMSWLDAAQQLPLQLKCMAQAVACRQFHVHDVWRTWQHHTGLLSDSLSFGAGKCAHLQSCRAQQPAAPARIPAVALEGAGAHMLGLACGANTSRLSSVLEDCKPPGLKEQPWVQHLCAPAPAGVRGIRTAVCAGRRHKIAIPGICMSFLASWDVQDPECRQKAFSAPRSRTVDPPCFQVCPLPAPAGAWAHPAEKPIPCAVSCIFMSSDVLRPAGNQLTGEACREIS